MRSYGALFLTAFFMTTFSIVTFIPQVHADGESCECAESTCGPCTVEVGTSFYSSKCGADLSRVKSCKKPTCEPVENQKQCISLMNSKGQTVAPVVADVEPAREPAAVAATPAGSVNEVSGTARILRAKGGTEVARRGVAVYNGDTAETTDGKLRIVLGDQSVMTLTHNSSVKIENIVVDGARSRNIALSLLRGRVRNTVSKGFSEGNVYEVKTRTAVAGVRGTDFIAAYELTDSEWITAVKTLEGNVRLNAINHQAEGDEHRLVAQGTTAALIVRAPGAGATDAQINEKIEKEATLTPLSYLNEEEMRLIRDATEFRPIEAQTSMGERTVASIEGDVVCRAPTGNYNQCSFTCEGNPKGDGKCRTDLADVSCVRRLCRANGQWAEPKRMPASQTDACQPAKVLVKECGSYW